MRDIYLKKVFRYTLQNYGIVLDDGERVLLENFEKREISIRLEYLLK